MQTTTNTAARVQELRAIDELFNPPVTQAYAEGHATGAYEEFQSPYRPYTREPIVSRNDWQGPYTVADLSTLGNFVGM